MTVRSDRNLHSDLARVRRVLARELETINEYEAFAEESEDPRIQAFFRHLAGEEKEHVAEAMRVIELLDAGQAGHLARPFDLSHLESPVAPVAPRPAPRVEPTLGPVDLLPPNRQLYSLQAPPHANAGVLTVGSLRNRSGR